MIPTDRYRHALDAGVYIPGVDASDPRDRTPIDIVFGETKRSAVFLILGQSNAGNHGLGPAAAGSQVYNFNLFGGPCSAAADPMAGATALLASRWRLLTDGLCLSSPAAVSSRDDLHA